MPYVSDEFIDAVSSESLHILNSLGFLTIQFCVLEDALNWFCLQLLAPLDIRVGEAMVLPLSFDQKLQRSRAFIDRYEEIGLFKQPEAKTLIRLLDTCKSLAERRNNIVHGTVEIIDEKLHFSRRLKNKTPKILTSDIAKALVADMKKACDALHANVDVILGRIRPMRKGGR